ncbi:MAG: hypothetical protein CMA63_06540 [Euryarchaeota archaeon]|nr:hypothetical protein [Euryarchaeota archaeon]|tara:strand:+ start:17645 stop:18010 length:366 start_codon:yes stop_codon:yes gene_type:complete
MMYERFVASGDPTGTTMKVRLPERYAKANRDGDRWIVQALNAGEASRLKREDWRVMIAVAEPAETIPSFDVLLSTVSALETALASGIFDAFLHELREEETFNKNRRTALAAIDERIETVDG